MLSKDDKKFLKGYYKFNMSLKSNKTCTDCYYGKYLKQDQMYECNHTGLSDEEKNRMFELQAKGKNCLYSI